MKVGDKVSYSKYVGVVINVDLDKEINGQPGCLVEYQTDTHYAWSGVGDVAANQSSSIKKILKQNCYYYWHYDSELSVIGSSAIKMISGINCTQCNIYNKYMELPEDKVSSWICTPCKS